MRIFVTHSAADSNLGSALAELLRASGEIVNTSAEMMPGDNVQTEVSAAIRSSDVLVAILTAATSDTIYELGLAAGANTPTVLAAPSTEILPASLAGTPYVRLGGNLLRDCQTIARRVQDVAAESAGMPERSLSVKAALETAVEAPSIMESLSSAHFERLVMDFFRQRGFDVTGEQPDCLAGDFTIQSQSTGQRVLVEVKKVGVQTRISIDTVRRFVSAVAASGIRGMLVATSDYTAAALDLAAGTPVILRTLKQLLDAQTQDELLGNDVRGQVASLSSTAAAWARKGYTAEAIAYYERAFALDEREGRLENLTTSLVGIAAAYFRKGECDKAIDYFRKALQLDTTLVPAFAGIAAAYSRKGEFEKAIEYYSNALRLDPNRVHLLHGIAESYLKRRDFPRAVEYYEKALQLGEETGNQQALSCSLVGIASALSMVGEFEKAIRYCERALVLNEGVGDRQGLASSLLRMASIHNRKGDFGAAAMHYERAATLQRSLRDYDHLRETLSKLVSTWSRIDEHARAERCMHDLAKLGTERPETPGGEMGLES